MKEGAKTITVKETISELLKWEHQLTGWPRFVLFVSWYFAFAFVFLFSFEGWKGITEFIGLPPFLTFYILVQLLVLAVGLLMSFNLLLKLFKELKRGFGKT